MTPKKSLYTHTPHPHVPRNVNTAHKQEIAGNGLNGRIADVITTGLGSMWCAYIFAALAVYGFPGFHATATQYVMWVSQTFIQLVALSVLQVASNRISRKQELLAEEQYQTTMKTYHDMMQVMRHLDAQDSAIIAIDEKVAQALLPAADFASLQASLTVLHAKVDALTTTAPPPSAPDTPQDTLEAAAAIVKRTRKARPPQPAERATEAPQTAPAPTTEEAAV